MASLEGWTAIATGSSSGIGSATAIALARRGCNIVVNYARREDGARAVAAQIEQLEREAAVVQGDVADDANCQRLAQTALDRWGRIDILVNNAGTTKFVDPSDLSGLSSDDFLGIYGVNVVGAYQMIRACAPSMKAQGDRAVINVSSTAGLAGMSSSSTYAASNGALNSLTIVWLAESASHVTGEIIRVDSGTHLGSTGQTVADAR